MPLDANAAFLIEAETAAARIAALPPRAALAREMHRVRRSEIAGSTALAGSRLDAAEIDALLDGGRAQGGHAFADYVLVRAYADAAAWVADARTLAAGDPRPVVTLDEVRQLNARVTAGTSARGGAWRQTNLAPRAGIVAPAAWMVARETETLIDRFGRGSGTAPLTLWLARFIGRLARVRPFEAGNGRTARLAVNLALRRLDVPPVVFEAADRRRYPAALSAAETGEPRLLARLLTAALVRTCNRLSTAGEGQTDPPRPLRAAAGDDYAALAKAAQRGRLRTIVRGGRYFTTSGWIAEYRAGRRGPS